MSADHAVFPLAPCEFRIHNTEPCRPATSAVPVRMWCVGCLGDGRRVLLNQGVPVEPASVPWIEGQVGGTADVWVEVES